MGPAFAVVGVAGYFAGLSWPGLAAIACAPAAVFLNAAFGYCLGCEGYLLPRRAAGRLTAE